MSSLHLSAWRWKRSQFCPPLRRERALEYQRDDRREAARRGQPQLGQPRRIDDGINGAQQDFEEEVNWNVLADESLAATFIQELAEIALNHFATPSLHDLEKVGRLALDVTQERRPNLVRMPLHAGEQPMQARGEI